MRHRVEAGSVRANQRASALAWAVLAATFLYLTFVVAPRRGVGLFEDEGLFLLNAWNAASGRGADELMPQSPHYLFNALFMAIGVEEVVSFRWISQILLLISSTLFFSGLNSERPFSLVVPICIALSTSVSLNTILSHYTVSIDFTLSALGTVFFARTTNQQLSRMLYGLAGVIFAIGAAANFAIGIGLIVIVAMILLLDSRARASWLPWTFVLTAVGLICTYLVWLGPSAILRAPVGHEGGVLRLASRSIGIGSFYVVISAAFFAILSLARWRREITPGRVRDLLVGGLTLRYLAAVFLLSAWGQPFTHSVFVEYLFYHIDQSHQEILGLGIWSLAVLTASSLNWAVQNLQAFGRTGVDQAWNAAGIWQKIERLCAWAQRDIGGLKLVLAISALVIIELFASVGSNSPIYVGMIAIAGPALGVSILLMDRTTNNSADGAAPIIWGLLFLSVCLLFASTYNHSSNEPIFSEHSVKLDAMRVQGVWETDANQKILLELKNAYVANECNKGAMLVTDYMPALHYILKHPPAHSMQAIRPAFYFPAEGMTRILAEASQYCVFHFVSQETLAALNKYGKTFDVHNRFINWLTMHSQEVASIPIVQGGAHGAISLFVKK